VVQSAQPSNKSDFFLYYLFLVEVVINLIRDMLLLLLIFLLAQLAVGAAKQNLHDSSDVLGQEGDTPVEHI